MKNFIIIFQLLIMSSTLLLGQSNEMDEQNAVKEALLECYVEGLHINRDSLAVQKGFHQDFVMHVFHNGQIIKVGLDMWLDRMKLDGKKNTNLIESEFKTVDVTGNTATVRMEIYENSKHIYTDYFGLYKFEEGWRIVNKIFHSHK